MANVAVFHSIDRHDGGILLLHTVPEGIDPEAVVAWIKDQISRFGERHKGLPDQPVPDRITYLDNRLRWEFKEPGPNSNEDLRAWITQCLAWPASPLHGVPVVYREAFVKALAVIDYGDGSGRVTLHFVSPHIPSENVLERMRGLLEIYDLEYTLDDRLIFSARWPQHLKRRDIPTELPVDYIRGLYTFVMQMYASGPNGELLVVEFMER